MTLSIRPLFIHITAAAAAMVFAYHVWQSPFAKTGVQFVTPMMIIIAIHVAWLAMAKQLSPGFAGAILKRSAITGVCLMLGLLAASILAPAPAAAQASFGDQALVIVFCVFIIAVIIAIIGFGLWIIYRLIKAIVDGVRANRDNDPDSRLFDVATLIAAMGILTIGSVEGISDTLTLNRANSTTTSQVITAPAETVWATMDTATSPDIPLPNILASFPQPTTVSVDEGTDLGARRVVDFAGREGAGCLILKVVERTATTVVFDVQNDTTPYANWIAYQRLTYEVVPMGDITRLDVTLHYDRLLSPAWFFGPAMNQAGGLAMDVLATDVKTRAEAALD